jgi:hypothetical protein
MVQRLCHVKVVAIIREGRTAMRELPLVRGKMILHDI